MALTQAQRTSMYTSLAEVMGQDDAETLMKHLPASGWDNVATKDDLRAGFAEINAAMAAGFAQAATERAEISVQAADKFAQAATERADGFAQAATERAEIRVQAANRFAQAATERAEVKAQAATERADGFAQAATERAEIKVQAADRFAETAKRQAWHLYIIVSTILVATVSIWIALLTQPGGG